MGYHRSSEELDISSAKLVGSDVELKYLESQKLLSDSKAYKAMAFAHNPYGDGKACQRIAKALIE